MDADEVQRHLDAIEVDEDLLAKLREEPRVKDYFDRAVIALEPVIVSGLEVGETLATAAVPGGPLVHLGVHLGAKLLEDAMHRWAERLKVGQGKQP